MCTQNLKTLASVGAEKSATEIFIGEKEKGTNKGIDKQYVSVFVAQYNSSLSSFVPNFRILSQVVAEKSLTEKKFTNKQTNRQTDKHSYRKAKTTYPLYTSYRGYNKGADAPVHTPYILRTGGIIKVQTRQCICAV